MPFEIAFQNFSSWPQSKIIPDATPFNDGVMTKAQAAALTGLVGVAFDLTITDVDGSNIDVTFPDGFAFVGSYSVVLTGYFSADDAPMIMTQVPRPGDPAPPTQAPDGFRINLQAPVTVPTLIRVKAFQ